MIRIAFALLLVTAFATVSTGCRASGEVGDVSTHVVPGR